MELPREPAVAAVGAGERAIRMAAGAFLGLAMLSLAFGLGYMVKDLRGETVVRSSNGSPAASVSVDPVGASILDQIYDLLKKNYVDRDTIDVNVLRQAAISGVITSLNDRETSYLTPDDVRKSGIDQGATYQGIGATVSSTTGQVQIVAPYRDSPAEKAGIKAGDLILEVNGERTDGWTADQAAQKVRGVKGTTVTLMVKHTDGKTESVSIVRGEIDIQSVFTEPEIASIPGESGKSLVDSTGREVTDIAYLNISQFHEKTVGELRTKAKDIESKGYKGLVLDVRSNPGGLLSATVDVAEEFLNSGTILAEKDGSGRTQTWNAKQGGILTRIPIIILMDKGSASGAEVLAAALRDNGRAKIVGTVSYGKGTVNQLMNIKDCGDPKGCGAIYMAVGRWLTPKGEQIEGTGVKPDVEVPLTANDYIDKGDLQLFKAIDMLRGK